MAFIDCQIAFFKDVTAQRGLWDPLSVKDAQIITLNTTRWSNLVLERCDVKINTRQWLCSIVKGSSLRPNPNEGLRIHSESFGMKVTKKKNTSA